MGLVNTGIILSDHLARTQEADQGSPGINVSAQRKCSVLLLAVLSVFF
jgi:hypothetical protein